MASKTSKDLTTLPSRYRESITSSVSVPSRFPVMSIVAYTSELESEGVMAVVESTVTVSTTGIRPTTQRLLARFLPLDMTWTMDME